MDTKANVILISAFAANPTMSSETGIGWIFVKRTVIVAKAMNLRVVVICNERSAQALRSEVENEAEMSRVLQVIGVPILRPLRFLERDPRLTRLEYLAWNVGARKAVRNLCNTEDVLLAQHVTFATEMLPTPINAAPQSVFRAWGPIGAAGDRNVYKIEPYTAEARKESRAHAVRDVVSKLASRVFGSNIDLVVAQNNAVAERFAEIGKEAIVFPNVVVKSNLSEPDSEFRHSNISQGMTVLCVGHLIARKRFEVAISVLSRPALDGATLLIAGAPLPGHREYLQAVAEAYEVADRVKFLGKLPRERVLAEMAKASVLFHPSGREGASGVVGEATFVGIPVVCFAKTGASSVLEASDSAGLALDAGLATLDSLAEAVVVGASMPRKRSDMWTEGRFDELISDLVERARVGRDRRSLADE